MQTELARDSTNAPTLRMKEAQYLRFLVLRDHRRLSTRRANGGAGRPASPQMQCFQPSPRRQLLPTSAATRNIVEVFPRRSGLPGNGLLSVVIQRTDASCACLRHPSMRHFLCEKFGPLAQALHSCRVQARAAERLLIARACSPQSISRLKNRTLRTKPLSTITQSTQPQLSTAAQTLENTIRI
jgi:hypothetical protein